MIINIDIIKSLQKEAMKSNMNVKHSACIIYRNKIVALGHNYMPQFEFQDKKSIHAERSAIMNLSKKFKIGKYKLTLVVIRISNKYYLMQSKPCIKCLDFINNINTINKVYYS